MLRRDKQANKSQHYSKKLPCESKNREHFLIWLCTDQSQESSGHASKPQDHKLNYRFCLRFSFFTSNWLLPCYTITFHKYFCFSRLSEFHRKSVTEIIKIFKSLYGFGGYSLKIRLTFVWILNHASKSITWSPLTLKASKLVNDKEPLLTITTFVFVSLSFSNIWSITVRFSVW